MAIEIEKGITPLQCEGCGMCIGKGFIEQHSHSVGNLKICGTCYRVLCQHGRLEVGKHRRGSLSTECALYLHPDGKIYEENVYLK